MPIRRETDVNETTLAEKIRTRAARVTVIGQGYVGLPLAVEFARAGFRVTGLDTDLDRVMALNAGRSYSPDVGSEDLTALLYQGLYEVSSDFSVLECADVVIVCVPTPLRKSKDPDISFVVAAGEEVAARFHPGQLVILESTTYPGTTEELLLPLFEKRGGRAGETIFLVFSPERIDPGNRRFKVGDIPKVIGGVTPACTRLGVLLYQQIIAEVIAVSSPRVAELAKLYENVFRNVNIALANEFAVMCHRLGVESREVIDAAATKPFGFMPFYPGPGIGGHCIPVDPQYLSWKMRLSGYEARFIALGDEINRSMPAYVVELVTGALNERRQSVNGSRIVALGVAYKRGVGDIRESPALEILATLHKRGAQLSYADPYVPSVVMDGTVHKAVDVTDETLEAADCVLILTDHPEFDYERVIERSSLVIDTRSATVGLPAPAGRVVRL
jgi:UDP-N-acetyl-D-glucosamine dehydrogenase